MPSALLSLFPLINITTSFPLSQLCVISAVGGTLSTIWKKKKKRTLKGRAFAQEKEHQAKCSSWHHYTGKFFTSSEIKTLQKPKFLSYLEALIVKVKYHE